MLLALGRRRETLRRLREDSAVALLLMGRGLAFTAHGRARVIAEELEATDTVVAVELLVERVQDHLADGRTEMLDGARWRWRAEEHGEAEDVILAELRASSRSSGRGPRRAAGQPPLELVAELGDRHRAPAPASRGRAGSPCRPPVVWWSTVTPQGVPISSWRR